MVTIVTRELGATAKGSPLSNAEGDNNLINLNEGKREKFITIKNMSGSTMVPGTVVYITGSNGENITASKASASSEATSSKTFAVVVDTIGDNATGRCIQDDFVDNLDTSTFTEGVAIWLSTTAGLFTQTAPTQPNHGVFIGYIVRSHASAGRILVKIQNGYELEELHNLLIASKATGDSLFYDGATGLWKNYTPAQARTLLDVFSKAETSAKAVSMAIALG